MNLRRKSVSAALGLIAMLSFPPAATADDSPYCEKVKDRAAADASLLFSPRINVQGIKFPSSGALDLGTVTGSGYQVRANAEFSPLDFYKGFRVLGVGRADCAQHEASTKAQELLVIGPDLGKLEALRKEAAYLDSRKADWEAIAQKTDERLAAHVISLVEDMDVHTRVSALVRKRIEIDGDIQRIAAAGEPTRERISALISGVSSTSRDFEAEASHVRSLDAWDVRVTGGVIPQGGPDYYGMVQVGFNFGAFAHNAYESSYRAARAQEVEKARYETVDQLRRFKEQLHAAVLQARREVEVLDKTLTSLASARAALEGSDAPAAPHSLGVVDLEIIAVTADRTELDARAAELSRIDQDDAH